MSGQGPKVHTEPTSTWSTEAKEAISSRANKYLEHRSQQELKAQKPTSTEAPNVNKFNNQGNRGTQFNNQGDGGTQVYNHGTQNDQQAVSPLNGQQTVSPQNKPIATPENKPIAKPENKPIATPENGNQFNNEGNEGTQFNNQGSGGHQVFNQGNNQVNNHGTQTPATTATTETTKATTKA